MSSRRSRKREPEINLSELIWALEDDVLDRRRARSEPPIRACRPGEPKFKELHLEFNFESVMQEVMDSMSAETTWQSESVPSKKSKRNKRRKITNDSGKPDEKPEDEPTKEEITVLVEEEAPSLFMTPPKSPDHEYSPLEAKSRLMDCVNEYRAQGDNRNAIQLISQLAQMAYCYNNKERPGERDYDNMEELVLFYKDAPQLRDPPNASDDPYFFLPQKQYLLRRAVRERLYGAVSLLRSQQIYSTPQIPEHYRNNPMMQSLVAEATALGRNCHTLALLLEDLHTIPDL